MKKLNIKDLVTIGVFTAIYFVMLTICTFLSFMLIPGISFMLLPPLAALVCGVVYMLLIARVQKFGAISILGIILGLFFVVSGHYITALLSCLICGIGADAIASIKKYKSFVFNTISYIVFSFGLMGPIFPMWFMRTQYIGHLTKAGKSMDNILAKLTPITNLSFIWCSLGVIVCAIIGAWFGKKLLKKHFEKAGII